MLLLIPIFFISCSDNVYEEPPVISVWDGSSSDKQWYDESAKAYSITSANALKGLSDLVAEGISFEDKTINLEVDIDLNNKPWTPIGSIYRKTNKNWFKGTFDGNNHKIINLYVKAEEDDTAVGLFGGVDSGEIRNLTIESGTIENTQDTAAGIVGAYLGDGDFKLINCTNKAKVVSKDSAAGIIGRIYGKGNAEISKCINYGSITGDGKAGGIAAINANGNVEISYSRNFGSIASNLNPQSKGNAGGLLGYMNDNCNISNLKNSGPVKGANFAGGIVGYMAGGKGFYSINYCENEAEINSGQNSGGIVGLTGDVEQYTIWECINKGTIKSDRSAGGVIGGSSMGNGHFASCKNTGIVIATDYAGGIGGALRGCDNYFDRCSGGTAEIKADYPGRLIGTADSGPGQANKLNIDDNNGDSYGNLRTAGCFADATMLPIWIIEGGTLHGLSPVTHDTNQAQLTFMENTKWEQDGSVTKYTEKNGTTFRIGKEGIV